MPFIVNKLSFDKIYYYANDKPLHVSVENESERHLQIMNIGDKSRRIHGRKAYGNEANISGTINTMNGEIYRNSSIFSHACFKGISAYLPNVLRIALL